VRGQDDIQPPAPSTGRAHTDVVSRSAAAAAAEASQRRLVQLSLLLCPAPEDQAA
jgi:hypothetical protein